MLHKAGASALDTRSCIHARCPAAVVPAAFIRSPVVLSLYAPSSSSSCSIRRCTCKAATVDAPSSSSSSSTSMVLRRSLLMNQLLEGNPQQQQQQQQGYEQDEAEEAPDSTGAHTSSSSSRAAGFGGKRQPKGQQQQQQQQRRSDVSADAPCPCKSGLRYKACCQPFVAATAYPKSAPELVRARITAALAGKPEFLVSTTHPDSSLALGGRRSLLSRAKRQAAQFRRNKCEVVGMAHCPGDEEGTWLVLAILQVQVQSSTRQLMTEKAPYMELIARKSWSKQQQQGFTLPGLGAKESTATDSRDGQTPAAAGGSEDRWMFYKQTNKLPDNGGAEALVALLQQHVPELLSDGEGDESAQQQGVINRQVYFNWVTPCFAGSSSSSSSSGGAGSSSGWYVDLLTPAVERLAASAAGSSKSSGAQAGSSSSSSRAAQQQLSLLPPGVFRMDDWLEQQRELHGSDHHVGRQKPAVSMKEAAAAAAAMTAQ